MTVPKMRTVSRGGSRYYIHPETKEKAVGVTSVINMLPKDFLKWWAAKMVAEEAVNNFGALASLVTSDGSEAAVDWLKRAHLRNTGEAAVKGTEVHQMVEDINELGGIPKRMSKALVPYARGWLAFMEATGCTIHEQETTVWSSSHGYSGTLDLSLTIPEETWVDGAPSWWEGSEIPILGDVKTTRSGVHAEVALQLAAYRSAEEKMVQDAEGVFHAKPWHQHQLTGLVVHLRPDSWQLVPVDIGADVFDVFVHLMSVFAWDKDIKAEVLYPALVSEEWTEVEVIELEKILAKLGGKNK